MSYQDFLRAYLNSLDLIINPPPIRDIAQWDDFHRTLTEHFGELRDRVRGYVDNAVDMILDVPPEAAINAGSNTGTGETARGRETQQEQGGSNSGNSTSSSGNNGSKEEGTSSEKNESSSGQAAGESQRAGNSGLAESDIDDIEVSDDDDDAPEDPMGQEGDYQTGFIDGFAAGIKSVEDLDMEDVDVEDLDMEDVDVEEQEQMLQLYESISKTDSSTNGTNEEASVVEREELLEPKPSKIPRLEGSVSSSDVPTSSSKSIDLRINGHRVSLKNYGNFKLQVNRVIITPPTSVEGDSNKNLIINEKKDEATGETYWEIQLDESTSIVRIFPREGASLQDFGVNYGVDGQLEIVFP